MITPINEDDFLINLITEPIWVQQSVNVGNAMEHLQNKDTPSHST